MTTLNEARAALVKMIVTEPDAVWTVGELIRQYPSPDVDDLPSPQMIRKIIASLPPACAKKERGVWQVQARHAAPTSEIYPAIDALISTGAISEKYTLIAAVAEQFAALTLIGVKHVDRALRYGAHGGKYTIEDGFYGPAIVLPSTPPSPDQRQFEGTKANAEGELPQNDQHDSLPHAEIFVRGSELREGDTVMYGVDPSTWLTVVAIDRNNRLLCSVHFVATNAHGKRQRKTASETRRYPVRRPVVLDRVTPPVPVFALPEPLL